MKPRTEISGNHVHSAIYGFGVIGALVYFIKHAETIWQGIIGMGEAILWPAVLVYKIFEHLKI